MKSATVALGQLAFDTEHNSRQGLDETAMAELVMSIENNGLITPLTVRSDPASSGAFLVIDGHRRLEALTRLYGGRDEEYIVPVLVRDADDKDARALSLAANIVRLPLHPADQYQAFAGLLDEGMERGEIASRFNLALKDVERILALGHVIPPVLEYYRLGKIDADTIRLFASCSEERQRQVWNKAYEDDSLTRWQVHRLLSDDTLNGDSPIVRLVGEEAYEAAGGRVERSLFNQDVRWLDIELAMKLARQTVVDIVPTLLAQGWTWVVVEADMPKQWRNWSREYAAPVFSAAEQAELDASDKRLDAIHEVEEEDWTDEIGEEEDALTERQHEIRTNAAKGYTPEQMAESGVVICEDFSIIRGLKKPAAVKMPEPGQPEPKPEVKGWSQALIDEVNSHGSVAAQLAIMREPNVADCMMLAGMYQDTVPDVMARVMALNSADRFSDREIHAGAEIQRALKSFGIKGAKFWSVYEQIAALSLPQREALRAVLVARAMKKRHDAELEEVFAHLGTVDISATWTPDKAFFERLNTAQLGEVHKELSGFALKEGIKKAEAVELTMKWAAQRNWVPKWLRKAQVEGKGTITVEPKKTKAKGPILTKVGEDGKTEKKKKAA